MTRTPETVAKHELVGLRVAVTDAPNEDLVGIAGRVIEETMHTLVVRPDPDGDEPLGSSDARPRQVPKRATTFAFDLPDGERVQVSGDRLVARPARRTETTGGSAWV